MTLKVFGVIAGLVVAVCLLFGGMLIFGFLGFQNGANQYENGIEAQYKENQNVYDNGWKKVVETAQVPDLYTEKLKELYDGTMRGRYGEDGSRAMLQFIQEQNPTIDASLFRQVQQTIEAFRNQFQQSQKELVSRKQAYSNFLTTNSSNRFYNYWIASFAGGKYPHIDLAKYDIVTSERTTTDFETKKAEPLSLRNSK